MFLGVTVTTSIMQSAERPQDGRSTRWAAHREQRRAELVRAAIAAIAHYGRDVDMEQVAAVAGVTKPVLYRYFADKAELFTAVGDQVARNVLSAVTPAISRVREERALVAATIDAYLGAIDGQPELYAFIMSRSDMPGVRQLIVHSSQTIAAGLARVIGDRLRSLGLDSGPAEPWAYGMVGMVQAVGDWWMVHGQPMSREALTDYLTTLLWEGLVGVRKAADVPGGLSAHADDAYRGPAVVTIEGVAFEVDVALAGHFEPFDGRFHWGGRISPHAGVGKLVRDGRTTAELAIGGDGKPVQLKDLDPWGGVRVRAVGAPPRALSEA